MHLLVFRFSAIGDVALCLPVLHAFRQQYPQVKLTVASRSMFQSLFEAAGINFISADFQQEHKNLAGLDRFFHQLRKKYQIDQVIDLHSVLRTHVLDTRFLLAGVPVFRINKGRKEKKKLTRPHNKVLEPLPHTTERYIKVFEKAGYPLSFEPGNPALPELKSEKEGEFSRSFTAGRTSIGVAPLATFPGKTWNVVHMKELMLRLREKGFDLYLFGGPQDRSHLEKISQNIGHCEIMAGQMNLGDEVVFMKYLDLMISMDSSNMHLATLAGIPVVSIWGATHRYAGFGPLGKNDKWIVEVPLPQLECRPCSVFGNKPCLRKDYACLEWISPDMVLAQVESALSKADD